MLQRLARWMLPRMIRWVDDTVPPAEIDRFLAAGMTELQRNEQLNATDAVSCLRLEQLGNWLAAPIAGGYPALITTPAQVIQADAWRQAIGQGNVLPRGVLQTGAGAQLDVLAQEPASTDAPAFVGENVERLLRHIETKRKKSLQQFSANLDPQAAWLERHGVAIFFARQARRTADWRLLNATCKLNDWAFPYYRRANPSLHSLRFLLALAEQAATWKEMAA